METEQQLQETYRNQENEYKAFRNEIKEQKDKLQLLNYKLNQTQQEKESYFQQVQVLTAEKEDLLLRYVYVRYIFTTIYLVKLQW